jgi:hypothetical protein
MRSVESNPLGLSRNPPQPPRTSHSAFVHETSLFLRRS